MMEKFIEWIEGIFDSGPNVSNTKDTNSYSRNVELCNKWQKEYEEKKKKRFKVGDRK